MHLRVLLAFGFSLPSGCSSGHDGKTTDEPVGPCELEWQYAPEGPSSGGVIAADADGNVWVALDRLLKLGPDGELLWSVDLPGKDVRDSTIVADREVVLVGSAPGADGEDIWYARFDADGTERWEREFDGAGESWCADECEGVDIGTGVTLHDDELSIVGEVTEEPGATRALWVRKANVSGETISTKTYDLEGSVIDARVATHDGSDLFVLLVGYQIEGSKLQRLDDEDGTVIWELPLPIPDLGVFAEPDAGHVVTTSTGDIVAVISSGRTFRVFYVGADGVGKNVYDMQPDDGVLSGARLAINASDEIVVAGGAYPGRFTVLAPDRFVICRGIAHENGPVHDVTLTPDGGPVLVGAEYEGLVSQFAPW